MITDAEIKAHHESCERYKKEFGPGPWTAEPNRVELLTPAGLPGLALRQDWSGHWCGYVGIKPGHRYYGQQYNGLDYGHGGTTYASFCRGNVCHKSNDEGEKIFWLGFDCAHAGDRAPAFK